VSVGPSPLTKPDVLPQETGVGGENPPGLGAQNAASAMPGVTVEIRIAARMLFLMVICGFSFCVLHLSSDESDERSLNARPISLRACS
jgi:hypothetical protein